MTVVRVILVRHARPDGTWGRDPDPGLDALGREQARSIATVLGPIGPLPIVVSPLRRTRETAVPLARHWRAAPRIDAGFGELATPRDPELDHATWLHTLMAGRGVDAPEVMAPFRDRVLGALSAIPVDSVVFSHFLAINAIVGAATDDDRVVCFAPGHCSRTVVEIDDGRLRVVERLGADLHRESAV